MKKVDAQVDHDIVRHHLIDGRPIGTLAQELGVHHGVVRRVLLQRGAASPTATATLTRARMLDA